MSSSLKVILFKGKILNNGEHPILIRVTKDRKSSYLSIGATSSLKNWDVRTGLPKKSHPDFKELLLLIDIKKHDISQILHLILLKFFSHFAQEILDIQTLALFLTHHYFHKVDMLKL